MIKHFWVLFLVLFVSCATAPQEIEPIKMIIDVQADGPSKVEVKKDGVARAMTLENPQGELSMITKIYGDKALTLLFSGLSVSDYTRVVKDLWYLMDYTQIRIIYLYINSPGGDAFTGLALANEIKCWQEKGFKFVAFGRGIIASAAVPIFAVCDERYASLSTMFMVHEASVWKWPGRETASDIRSQNELMTNLGEQYRGILERNSSLTAQQWAEKEGRVTWFPANKAKDWGLVDAIQ